MHGFALESRQMGDVKEASLYDKMRVFRCLQMLRSISGKTGKKEWRKKH